IPIPPNFGRIQDVEPQDCFCCRHPRLLPASTNTQIWRKSPVFQSLKSASSISVELVMRQQSSVLSVNRTRMESRPSSNTWSANSTTLPWMPRYCLPCTALGADSLVVGPLRLVMIQFPSLAAHCFSAISPNRTNLFGHIDVG